MHGMQPQYTPGGSMMPMQQQVYVLARVCVSYCLSHSLFFRLSLSM